MYTNSYSFTHEPFCNAAYWFFGEQMSPPNNQSDLVSSELLDQAYADLNALQMQLPDDVVAALAREVIERLVKIQRTPETERKTVLNLAEALIGPDPKAAARIVSEHINSGAHPDAVYLSLLAPAAERLGQWWETDEIPFTDVTVGTGRIYAIMRTLAARQTPDELPSEKSALFATVPGEDHALGVRMAADMARKEGWTVDVALDLEHDALVERIVQEKHLLVGLSAAGAHALPNLARLILALRTSAPKARILVSGHIAELCYDSVRLMHVDAIGQSFDEAMSSLDQLWTELTAAQK